MGGNGSLGHTHVELRLGIVDAVPHTPFLARCRRHTAPGIGGGLELPLLTVIGRSVAAIHVSFSVSVTIPSMSTWMVATIRAW